MKRECFKRGNMSPEYYTSVVESVRKAKAKYCNDDCRCSECPFETKSYCLLNTLEHEFEEYAEDKRKIIKKRFVDLTELEVKNIITDIQVPDFEYYDPKKIIDGLRKFVNDLETLEVELYEVEEDDKGENNGS